ncbi:Exonuclease VII, large subunit [Pseudarthrobacter equi]|uniref:Exonuclease VII, large subunit n=1 Tax=Pseudarthrobacter equi TaxID=728066 RepID=A0A1H1X062_9MICC|nr:Exonuclease VII, large subunit [Pseudarthrobacter equi]
MSRDQKPTSISPGNSVSQVRGWVGTRVQHGEITISGECMAPRKTNGSWNFDLVSVSPKGAEILSCVVWENMVPGIDAMLSTAGSSIGNAMSEGMVLTLKGTLWLDAEGTIGVRVTAIEPGFVRRGDLYLEGKKSIALLRAAGVPRSRLTKEFRHDNPEHAFKNLGCKPERVMVVGPANAKGVGDLQRRLWNSRSTSPEVFYRPFSWTAAAQIGVFQAHLQEAQELNLDLVLLVQGGGHWRWLRGYQRADLALAIKASRVPVATAVGHDSDVSLADRAATLSFTTPTAAGEAIANELSFQRRQQVKTTRQAAAREVHQAHQAAKEADRASREKRTEILESQRSEALADARTAQQREAEANSRFHMALRVHTQDLLETAESRVRFMSYAASVTVLVVVTALVAYDDQVLAVLQLSPDTLPSWLYHASVVSSGAWLLVWQRRARKSAWLASASPMKHPPSDLDSWRFAIKRVRTVRKLRLLRHHTPR